METGDHTLEKIVTCGTREVRKRIWCSNRIWRNPSSATAMDAFRQGQKASMLRQCHKQWWRGWQGRLYPGGLRWRAQWWILRSVLLVSGQVGQANSVSRWQYARYDRSSLKIIQGLKIMWFTLDQGTCQTPVIQLAGPSTELFFMHICSSPSFLITLMIMPYCCTKKVCAFDSRVSAVLSHWCYT